MKTNFDISQLIAGWMTGELPVEERERLEAWRRESPENELLFFKITDADNRRHKRELMRNFDKNAGWTGVLDKRQAGIRRKRFRSIAKYAAAILLPLCLTVFLLTEFAGPIKEIAAIVPGTPSAKLILPSGEEVDLSGITGAIAVSGEETAFNDGGKISYNSSSETQTGAEPIYHRMVVPKGGEYRLELRDGTVIHLNSMTSIRFPVDFTGDMREVTLDGEAYFEVAPDPEKPFIVHTDNYDVRVVGTAFNVSAYTGDPRCQTTLISGSVAIENISGGDGVALKPGEQFEYSAVEGSYSVATVDVSYATAWKEGRLRFRDERLDDIMRMVERWYDVEVEYADEDVRAMRFGFNIGRQATVDPILTMFEENGKVKIERKGREIIIKSAK